MSNKKINIKEKVAFSPTRDRFFGYMQKTKSGAHKNLKKAMNKKACRGRVQY